MNTILYKLSDDKNKILYWELQTKDYVNKHYFDNESSTIKNGLGRVIEGDLGGKLNEGPWKFVVILSSITGEVAKDCSLEMIEKKKNEGYVEDIKSLILRESMEKMTQEQLLDAIFEENGNKWKGKYDLSYCDMCEVWSVSCKKCQTSSCSGGISKDDCNCIKDFEEFYNFKQPFDYLSTDELAIFEKIRRLKKMTQQSYLAGFSEINWEYLGTNGKCSENDEKCFPELKNYPYKPMSED